jgi:hypothetical protein
LTETTLNFLFRLLGRKPAAEPLDLAVATLDELIAHALELGTQHEALRLQRRAVREAIRSRLDGGGAEIAGQIIEVAAE